MLTFDDAFSLLKDFLPLLTAGGAVFSAAGLMPRIGPGRAAWIALYGRFARKPTPYSLRLEETMRLRSMLADIHEDFGQGYVVVTGEKGVGKTCLISTVTSKTPGVIDVKVPPGINDGTIVKKSLRSLTRMPFDFMPLFDSAQRVIYWHRVFTLGRSPIIVLNATERRIGKDYADLTGAVRILVDTYHLRVIVDGSPNSLDGDLLLTDRECETEVKPMTKDMLWRIEQCQGFLSYVEKAGLDDTVFATLGGVPSRYAKIWTNAKYDLQNGQDARDVIGSHLCSVISAAIEIIGDSCGNDEKVITQLSNVFHQTQVFTKKTLVAHGLKRPTRDKVFRKVKRNGVFILVPASNALGIVLRHNLTQEPTLDELENLIKLDAQKHLIQ